MPVPDEVLEARAMELGLIGEAGEPIDAAAIRGLELPLIELAILTGYSASALALACKQGKLEGEMRPHPRAQRQGWFTTLAAIEDYRAKMGTPHDWGLRGAEKRWG